MANIIRRPMLSDGRIIGTSYFAGEVELHFPPSGRPEVYVGAETIDAGLLGTVLPDLVKLFNDTTVRAAILRACANP
jgi:hypothetical protein